MLFFRPAIAAVGTLAALLSACQLFNPVLATVAGEPITRRDVERREAVNRIYYPEYSKDLKNTSLQQLVNARVLQEILESHGRPVTDELLRQEALRIDRDTRKPDLLAQVKAVFGADEPAYLRNYVLPVIVERLIYYEFFLKDPRIDAKTRANYPGWLAAEKAKVPVTIR
ncbi:MAG: SurA N-terminal domain-containing protein [Oligoflexia bacterium]|nr:SurA N-terminal domain-containing protein [Oligoflexia bacterium]